MPSPSQFLCRFVQCFPFLWMNAVGAPATFADVPPTRRSPDQLPAAIQPIFAKVDANTKRIQSLDVTYEEQGVLLGTEQDAQALLRIVYLPQSKKRFAFKLPDFRYSKIEQAKSIPTIARDTPTERSPEDVVAEVARDEELRKIDPDLPPASNRLATRMPNELTFNPTVVSAFDGKQLRRWQPGDWSNIYDPALLQDRYKLDGGFFSQDYLQCIDMALPDVLNKNDDRAADNLALALLQFDFEMDEKPEVIDGSSCIVLSRAGHQRIVLDPTLGYAVRVREEFDPRTGTLLKRYSNTQFTEIEPGLWLPQASSLDRCGPADAPSDKRGLPLFRLLYTVKELKLNGVSESLFGLQFPGGTKVIDQTHTDDNGIPVALTFTMPANESEIETAIQLSQNHGEVPVPSRPTVTFWRSNQFWVNVALGCLAIVAFAARKIGRSRASSKLPAKI